jgi:hypothetical protein
MGWIGKRWAEREGVQNIMYMKAAIGSVRKQY